MDRIDQLSRIVDARVGPRLLAVGVILLGTLLRFFRLVHSTFWLDEIHSLERASQPTLRATYALVIAKNHAPLFDTFLHFWRRLGDSPFVLRLPAVFFGVLTIAVTFAVARRFFNRRVGLLSSLLLALSPVHIYYSRETRMYTLVTLFVALGIYLLGRALQVRRRATWHWVAYAAVMALALYTHYYAGFSLLALSLFAALYLLWHRAWRTLSTFLAAGFAIALLFLPWLPNFWRQLQNNPVAWLPEPTGDFILYLLGRFFLEEVTLDAAYPYLALLLLGTFTLGLVLTRYQRKVPNWAVLFVIAVSVGPFLLAALASLVKPLLFDRYLLVAVPPAAVALAVALNNVSKARAGKIVALLLLAAIVVSAYGIAAKEWKPDWQELAGYLADYSSEEEPIYVVPAHFLTTLAYHHQGVQEVVGVPAGAQAPFPVDDTRRFWVIAIMPVAADEPVLAYLDRHHELLRRQRFGEQAFHARLFLYEKGRSP